MTYYNNYKVSIIHPTLDEPVYAILAFDYTEPSRGTEWEPPEFGGIEITEVVVDGEDILQEYSPHQLEALEDEIFAVENVGSGYEPFDTDWDEDF